MIERKCLKCGTWNEAEKFCKNCGAAVAPEEIIKEEESAKRIVEGFAPKDKLEILIERARGSKYVLVRIMFYSAYTVGVIVAAIGSFLAYLIAWTAG